MPRSQQPYLNPPKLRRMSQDPPFLVRRSTRELLSDHRHRRIGDSHLLKQRSEKTRIRTAGVTLRALAEYAQRRGLQYRRRQTILDLTRFTKPTKVTSQPRDEQDHIPIVLLSPLNAVCCEELVPNVHGCVYTASPTFEKVCQLSTFHLFVRLEPPGNTLEKARYYGIYTAREGQRPLNNVEWQRLALQEKTSVLNLHEVFDPEVPREEMKKAYDAGGRELTTVLLENRGFDRNFYDEVMAIDISLVHPVALPECLRRKSVDWKKVHEEWMDEMAADMTRATSLPCIDSDRPSMKLEGYAEEQRIKRRATI
ncbi:uncharacterized protein LAESUDRAFT_276187 [Laetiporus sulphureus 93-53]|uniref:Uncharacterized protein n=1 Tax=Laetiporus sulphureus 93-53 TaxID=1314785 RepID=A0A165HCT6_9APHY|nr:uncharacterized protein LAESUDRAFT_276187 [Laetiporus sulphureus 93-53]KZT11559.1 hypothetical protein LAESUDRAFT_276187 [Laetiporus sulphureus 93-53]